jgi:hypothetical protein
VITTVLLCLFFLACAVAGGAVAFNIRGAADAYYAYAERNAELRQAARADFGPPRQWVSKAMYRGIGGILFVCGTGLTLGFLSLLTG